MVKRLISLLLLISYLNTLAFYFQSAIDDDQLASSKPTANITIAGQYYNFTLGKGFQMRPVIDLESGLSYVFCQECNSEDRCKKGKPPVIFNNKTDGGKVELENGFSFKLPSQSDTINGDLMSADFKIANITFNTQFGCVKSGSKNFQSQDMALGLGFGTEGMTGYKEPINSIFNSTKERGIVIKNGKNAGDGYIMFGITNDTVCSGMFLSKAWKSAKGLQMWWLRFDRIVSGKGEEENMFAAFDFTTDDLTLPKSLYDSIGSDSVPDLKSLQDIVFELGDYTIVLHPKHYTKKTENGRYRPAIQQSMDDSPTVKLGASFYRDRCIVLNGEDNNYRIGISQLPDDGVGQIEVSVLLVVFSFLIGLYPL